MPRSRGLIPATMLLIVATLGFGRTGAAVEPTTPYPGGAARIAFMDVEHGIWTVLPDGRELRRISTGSDYNPRWSPDGRQILFSRDLALSVMSADGTNVRRVLAAPSLASSWSPDGRVVLYHDDHAIRAVRLDGTAGRLLAGGGSAVLQQGDFSPDGRRITYTTADRLIVMNADGTGARPLPLGSLRPIEARWSPDGGWIAFTRWTGPSAGDLYVIRPDGTGLRQLTHLGTVRSGAWSPTGRELVVDAGLRQGLMIVRFDGTGLRSIPGTAAMYVAQPDWQRIVTADPRLSVGDTSVVEGDVGDNDMTFTVTLSGPQPRTVSVRYRTVLGTAAADDLRVQSGTVTLPVGVTSAAIVVTVYGDTRDEQDETFSVRLSDPQGATIARSSGTGRILTDD